MTTRRGFLRSLGILAATACIPEHLEKAVEFVEKKSDPAPSWNAMADFKTQAMDAANKYAEKEREKWWRLEKDRTISWYEEKGFTHEEAKLVGVVFFDVHGNQMEFIKST